MEKSPGAAGKTGRSEAGTVPGAASPTEPANHWCRGPAGDPHKDRRPQDTRTVATAPRARMTAGYAHKGRKLQLVQL